MGISISVVSMIIFSVVSVLIGLVLEFFVYGGDYTRTERLEYEDDEYYYYVKAVPKAIVAGTDKKVTRFSGKEEQDRMTKKRFAEEMEIDEDLLD